VNTNTPPQEPTNEAPTVAWTPPGAEPSTAGLTAPPVVPEPVQAVPSGARSGRGGGLRLAAALAVVAVVVGATVAVAALLTGSTSQASVLRYVPQDTVIYGELRLDLPGDQRQAAGEFLSKFPGFKDQAALDTKLDEALDQIVGEASNDKQTFTKNIKPWFDGEFAFAIGPLPKDVLSGGASAMPDARALLLLSVKDAAAASAWFTDILSETGTASTTETYEGVQLTVVAPTGDTSMAVAFAILGGDVAVAGDIASVKAAVDTGGSQSLASDPAFKAAAGSSNDDYLGFAYVDTKALVAATLDASGAATPAIGASVTALIPDWTAYRLRVEPDALVGVATNPHVDRGYGATTNRTNKVVDHVPSSAMALVAGNDVGSTWVGALDALRSETQLKDLIDGIDQATGIFGGVSDTIGWIGDAGVVVEGTGSEVAGGVVIVPTDPAKASKFFTTLKTFIALGGGSAGLTVHDQAYGDATITVVSIDLRTLGALAGAASGGAADGLTLPSGTVDLAYTVTDDVVVIGSSPAFVEHVLDTNASNSIASTPGFDAAVGRVGKDVTGLTYLDIAAVRTFAEGRLSGDELAKYKTDVQPFLEPFETFAATSTVGGEFDTFTTVITVK
jgi:Protein of unknown function (DUF3352)